MGGSVPDWVVPTGWGGLVLSAVAAIYRGWLIPGRTLDLLTKQWEARLAESQKRETDAQAEAQTWREAWAVAEESRRTLAAQVETMLTQGETMERLVRAIREGSDRDAPAA